MWGGMRPDLSPHTSNPFFSFMRKIEQQMNTAISNNADWQSANTRVEFDADTNESTVYLHGNKIAEVGDNYIRLFDGGWQSNTTKSRLNAIMAEHGIAGEGVFQHKFEWFIRLYNGTEFFVTEFRDGMKLGALAAKDLLVWFTLTVPWVLYTQGGRLGSVGRVSIISPIAPHLLPY